TPEINREHAQHPYRIEPVRLGSSSTAVDEDAGGLEYIVGDAMRCKQTVQPEPVTTGLKAADNPKRSLEPASQLGAQGRNESEEGGGITAIDPMQVGLFGSRQAGGDEPA